MRWLDLVFKETIGVGADQHDGKSVANECTYVIKGGRGHKGLYLGGQRAAPSVTKSGRD